jgi:predicted CoA-binding protein
MSDKPIVQRLSLKPGYQFLLINPPAGYTAAMGELPAGVRLLGEVNTPVEAIQVFVRNRQELEALLPRLKQQMAPKGMLWVTYHKGTSKVKTDINRDTINAYAQTLGMQGVAMISIDEDWAALRLKLIQN